MTWSGFILLKLVIFDLIILHLLSSFYLGVHRFFSADQFVAVPASEPFILWVSSNMSLLSSVGPAMHFLPGCFM